MIRFVSASNWSAHLDSPVLNTSPLISLYSLKKSCIGLIVWLILPHQRLILSCPPFPPLPPISLPPHSLDFYIWWIWLLCFHHSKFLVSEDSPSNLILLFCVLSVILQIWSALFSRIFHRVRYSVIVWSSGIQFLIILQLLVFVARTHYTTGQV